MIYQINGKRVNKKEISKNMKKFVKIVIVPNKLTNYITKEVDGDQTVQFWISPKTLFALCITLLKNFGRWTHFTVVHKDNHKRAMAKFI